MNGKVMGKPRAMKLVAAALLALWCGLGSASSAWADVSTTYLFGDALGSPVVGTDELGAVLWRKQHRPFGETESFEVSAPERAAGFAMGFTGHREDDPSGLIDMGARVYDPRLGVFLQPDPAPVLADEPFTYNRYIYANQSPYTYVDPGGRKSSWAFWAQTAAEIAIGFTPAGIILDVIDLGKAVASGNPADIAIAVVGFVSGGDALKAIRKVSKAVDHVADVAKPLAKRADDIPCVGGGACPTGKGCFVAGTPVVQDDGSSPIEALEVGDRVQTQPGGSATAVDGTWRTVRLRVLDGDQQVVAALLRPWDELVEMGAARPGDTFDISLPEMGVEGVAVVLSVDAAPDIPAGSGRVVTGTFTRLSNDVYEVSFAEAGEPLRGTGAHPLYSLDRDDWVRVRDLQVGERLQTAEGAVSVEALEKVRGLHRVYNLEVEGNHEYLVGAAAVRAHNTGCGPSYSDLKRAGESDAHHIIQDAAVRDLPGYSRSAAPAVKLDGPSTRVGSPHYNATQVQRQAGGGTYAAERRIGHKALRRAGMTKEDARAAVGRADEYFESIGVGPSTPTRVPGNR